MERQTIRISMAHEADVTRALLGASLIAKEIGFTEVEAHKIATVTSELARNILKYAGRGEVILGQVNDGGKTGVEIIARDRGPGIADTEQAMADHFSSSGTLGLGLPGAKRMMDEFEIQSAEGQGTTVRVKKWLSR